MPNYNKGQIYKIVDVGYNKCYIGSTTQKLSDRIAKHRLFYKQYKQGKKEYVSIFDIFDEFGVENCKIEWIEDYPCDNRKQLEAREGHYQQELNCVNKNLAGRTKKEYREEHREYLSQIDKERYLENKEKILEKQKYNYQNNKERILQRQREYRDKNPEKLREQSRRSYEKNKYTKTDLINVNVV